MEKQIELLERNYKEWVDMGKPYLSFQYNALMQAIPEIIFEIKVLKKLIQLKEHTIQLMVDNEIYFRH